MSVAKGGRGCTGAMPSLPVKILEKVGRRGVKIKNLFFIFNLPPSLTHLWLHPLHPQRENKENGIFKVNTFLVIASSAIFLMLSHPSNFWRLHWYCTIKYRVLPSKRTTTHNKEALRVIVQPAPQRSNRIGGRR